MNLDWKTGLAALVANALGFLLLRFVARRSAFRSRDEMAMEDLYHSFAFKVPVPLKTFTRLISLIGNCYHVPAGKLRAGDRFDGILGQIDSWDLGESADKLVEMLEREYSIHLPEDRSVKTVQDLIEYCHGAVGGQSLGQ